jgi:transcriptional regulator of heat shock response
MNKLQSGGWQVTVKYLKDHVIKTPNTSDRTMKKISEHLQKKNKLEETRELTIKIGKELEDAIKIIQASDIPKKLLAYPEFLEGGKIKQRRVVILDRLFEDLIKKGKIKEAKKLMDRTLEFIVKLWRYGLHEKTFKFYSGYGILDNQIVLTDFGEITDDYEKVKKQLKGKGPNLDYLKKAYTSELIDYFSEQKKKILTTKRLKENWRKNLSV